MKLYQEIPKRLIANELNKRFTPEELSTIQPELNELLHSCSTAEQLFKELTIKISRKGANNQKSYIKHYRI